MIIKNLSKPRFILILTVAMFLLLILVVQFVVLCVYRSKAQELKSKLDEHEKQTEQSSSTTFLNTTLTESLNVLIQSKHNNKIFTF